MPTKLTVLATVLVALAAPAIAADHVMVSPDSLERSSSHALTAGSVGIMQPKTNHFAWTSAETIVQVHGTGPWGVTYVNPADDPPEEVMVRLAARSSGREL